MKDILENFEDAAEKRYEEMFVDENYYKCGCGAIVPNCEMNFVSSNPYSEPVCGKCLEKYLKEGRK